MKYIVYLTINTKSKINGLNRIYVGVHKTEDPDTFDGYLGNGVYIYRPSSYMHPKTHFQFAVKKYGIKNFIRTTLKVFDNEEDDLSIEAFENQDDALIFQSAMNYPEPPAPQSTSKQSSFKTSSITSRNDRQTSTNKKIVKVLVFYSDNTYQELK